MDSLIFALFQGGPGISQPKTPLRAQLEQVGEPDEWTSVCPYRVGYDTDDDALTLLYTVRPRSMTTQRAVAVVAEARRVLAR